MSLTTAIDASLSSLQIAQRDIALRAHNIANKDTPGFVKQQLSQSSVNTGEIGQGTQIDGISATVDEQLASAIRVQNTAVGESTIKNTFYETIQALYGKPDSATSLNAQLDSFFDSIQALSADPQLSSVRQDTLIKAKSLADKISSLATDLHKQRFEADQTISETLSRANEIISDLSTINGAVVSLPDNSSAKLETLQQRDLLVNELASIINISTFVDSNDQLSVTAGSGTAILDNNRYRFNYTPVASEQSFIDGLTLDAIDVSTLNAAGVDISDDDPVVVTSGTSGTSGTITSTIAGGALKGLIELRDTEIPRLIEQLDSFSVTLRNEMNAIHNDGGAVPPLQTLTGTRGVTNATQVGFSGNVRIAVLDATGQPVTSPYTDETNYRPLTLDLSSLNSGSGAGKPTVQTIIDEINEYYGPPQARAVIGDIRDIRLAALDDSITDEDTSVSFDLQLDSISATDSTVEVLSALVLNPADDSTIYTVPGGSLPSAYTLTAGARERTGSSNAIVFDLSPVPDLSTYKIRLQVRVTEDDGTVSTANVDYSITETASGLLNDRYPATAMTNVNGTSTYYAAPSGQQFLQANLVDSNGVAVTPGTSGFLQLKGDNTGYRVVIDESTSTETGAIGAAAADITSRGFSHYFELNDFFVTNNDTTNNSAVNFAVRSDIVSDHGLITRGRMVLSNQPADTSNATYTYELGSGSNQALIEMVQLTTKVVSFEAAGTLPQGNQNLSGYISDVVSYAATEALRAQSLDEIHSLSLEGLKESFQEAYGVNVDEQLARIIEIETVYRASARLISIVDELLGALLAAF